MNIMTRTEERVNRLLPQVIDKLDKEIQDAQSDSVVVNYTVCELLLQYIPSVCSMIKESKFYNGKIKQKVGELQKVAIRLNTELDKMCDIQFLPSVVRKLDLWYQEIPRGFIRPYMRGRVMKETNRMYVVYRTAISNYLLNTGYDGPSGIKCNTLVLSAYAQSAYAFECKVKDTCLRIHRSVGSEATVRNTTVGKIIREIAEKVGFIDDCLPKMEMKTDTIFYNQMIDAGKNLIRYVQGQSYRQKFDYIIGNRQLAYQYMFFAVSGIVLNKTKKLDPMVREALRALKYYRSHTFQVMAELRRVGKIAFALDEGKRDTTYWNKVLDEVTMEDLPHLYKLQKEVFEVKTDREEKTFKDLFDEFINSTEIL